MDKSAVSLPTLRALAHKMQTSGLSSLALDGKAWSVRLTFADRPSVLPAIEMPAPVTTPLTHIISAPMPGTLLRRHPQSQHDFVTLGQQVQANEVVALVQVGPLYVPVLSPASGTVQTLTPAHLAPVQYDEEIIFLQLDS
ncbi:biotin/lipoyl-containing protein [Pantoea sp.]|uniref:acetyl-CoA carboxylase biotin carboxyl carrier protein n=1 Tax=Pantoea sp. TaxID=69393 RepID=UPI0031D673DF